MTPAVRQIGPREFDWSEPSGAAAAMRDVLTAAEAADGAAPLDEAALLRLRHRGVVDSVLLVSAASPGGFAWAHDGELAVVVHPDVRRSGHGQALVAAALSQPPDGSTRVETAWSHGNHPGAGRLAERFGFERVRDLWVMRRQLADLPATADSNGFAIRPFRPGHDEDAFLRLNAVAFAGHPEQGGMTRGDLDQRMAEPWFDANGFFVAEAASAPGRLVGFHWTKVHDTEPPVGEVYVVGVSPDAQGSGLGRLLTLTGLHHLASRGLEQVLLYVESDNAPAIAVYSRLGFDHAEADTHVQYRRR